MADFPDPVRRLFSPQGLPIVPYLPEQRKQGTPYTTAAMIMVEVPTEFKNEKDATR
jgi:hypothetical protein